jgi:hypothetical protein
MKILVTGNPNKGLAAEISKLYPDATFVSRATGFDLTTKDGYKKVMDMVTEYDVFINSSALWKFNQTLLLDAVYKRCYETKHPIRIICIGSTTDRVAKGGNWLYNAEKKALRDYCNSLGITGVWEGGPRVTLVSFGSLSNVQEKHPDRKCLDISTAASYIKWVVEQPADICVNELSIDPQQ